MPGCSGSTTISPAASRENAIRPGPWAMLRMCGMPPSVRFIPPPVFIAAIGTLGSFHSIT